MEIASTLIVDDHPKAQRWLAQAVVAAFPNSRCSYADCVAAARAERGNPFDLVLLDIGLPDGSGLDLVDEFVSAGAQVVISSIYEDDAHLFDALRLGATGYLLKDHPVDEIIRLLQGIVLDGRPPLSPKIAHRILGFFASNRLVENEPAQTQAQSDQALLSLTPREQDVLTLLAKGYTIPNVAELLGISPHTVNSYTKSVYKKLNVTSRAEATLEATRFGLVDSSRANRPSAS